MCPLLWSKLYGPNSLTIWKVIKVTQDNGSSGKSSGRHQPLLYIRATSGYIIAGMTCFAKVMNINETCCTSKQLSLSDQQRCFPPCACPLTLTYSGQRISYVTLCTLLCCILTWFPVITGTEEGRASQSSKSKEAYSRVRNNKKKKRRKKKNSTLLFIPVGIQKHFPAQLRDA